MTDEQPSPPPTQDEPRAQEPAPGLAPTQSRRRKLIWLCFWLSAANCAASWLLGARYLRHLVEVSRWSLAGWLHFPLAYLSHFAMLHLALFALAAGLVALLPRRWVPAAFYAAGLPPVHLLFYVDSVVYANYRMHLNPAIATMLTAPGAGDLVQLSARDWLKGGIILVAVAALELAAAWLLWRLAERRPPRLERWPRRIAIAAGAVLAAVLLEKAAYACADLASRRDVLVNAERIPFYLPATCKHLARRLGVEVDRQCRFESSLALRYPLEAVEPAPDSPRYNVLWVAVEGWRFDMLTPEVAPRLSAFAARCLTGERHYSSGNCSRFGVFGMFYGLDGFYWQSFKVERQGPVLVDVLRQLGYEFRMMGAANFTNPEFRLTCFARLPDEEVMDGKTFPGESDNRDRLMLWEFRRYLSARDATRPFFCFLFLDSPHAPYRFQDLPGWRPPFQGFDAIVRHDRLATDEEERRQAFTRYRNSIAYVDFLLGGALGELERRGLLERTIVMIAGDHGEEFGECGYYGHNGSFDDYQVRTPFILHYPGVRPGRIAKLTSHADWAPTVLRLLGVRTPPEAYSQGVDILGDEERSHVVAGSYSSACIIARDGTRLVFPFEHYRLSTVEVLGPDYRSAAGREAALARHAAKLEAVLRESGRFRR